MIREETIKMLKSKMDGNTDTSYEWCECMRLAIKALEQTRWIPVTERLPEEDGEYFVTWTTSRSKRPLLEICEYSCGMWDMDNGSAYSDAEVIAWMSLPECYKS